MDRIARILAGMFCTLILIYSCGSSPAPPPPPLTCTRTVTITASNDLAGNTVQLATTPAICLCSDSIVRSCQ
jgi:hypothetical protein